MQMRQICQNMILLQKIIRDYISETGYEFDVSEADLSLYSDFNERFSPDKLAAIPDDELLKTIFLHCR